mgnify:CR=1 FL=1
MTSNRIVSIIIGVVSSVGVYSAIADILMAVFVAFLGGVAAYLGNLVAKKLFKKKRKNINENRN